MNDVSAFSAQQVMALTGLSARQLAYWDRLGFFRPHYSECLENGRSVRLHSFRDLVGLRVLALLRNSYNVPLQQLHTTGATADARLGRDHPAPANGLTSDWPPRIGASAFCWHRRCLLATQRRRSVRRADRHVAGGRARVDSAGGDGIDPHPFVGHSSGAGAGVDRVGHIGDRQRDISVA